MKNKKKEIWRLSESLIKKVKQQIPIAAAIMLMITGCSDRSKTVSGSEAAGSGAGFLQAENIEDPDPAAQHIASVCCDIFEEAVEENAADSLEVVRSIVDRLGDNGYIAVDSKNQVDMTEPARAIRFCEQAQAGEKAELTMIAVTYTGGLTKYELCSENGNLDIVKNYYQYENGKLENKSTVSYTADFWQYTEEGYLLFTGSYFSPDYYIFAVGNMPVCTALRIQPLDEKCRELNRKYILPLGYSKNNMFISDWDGQDFGNLDFYDLFDKFYFLLNAETVPYKMDENLGVGAVYRIPKDEFENVIMEYLGITPEILRSKTKYFPEEHTYEYKPRGFFEAESTELPYPEVAAYEENSDGTLTLTVNAVFPERKTSKSFAHEVVIRPLAEGGVHYVSNKVLPSEDNKEQTWHRPRLTEEQWEEFYED